MRTTTTTATVVVYQRARVNARRLPTFLLRRRERRCTARCRRGVPDAVVLAHLAAIRAELAVRSGGSGGRR